MYGTVQPATVATKVPSVRPVGGQAASGGSKTANAISSGIALASGTPSWYSLVKSDNTRWHEDTVGASGSLVFANGVTQIVAGATIAIDALTLTEP